MNNLCSNGPKVKRLFFIYIFYSFYFYRLNPNEKEKLDSNNFGI